jgi:hypothetical protein
MELQTLNMPVADAREAFYEYRTAVRSSKTARANSEDAEIMRCYKALADGREVLDINKAFEIAGFDDSGRPRLAIARADEVNIELYYVRDYDLPGGAPRVWEMGPRQFMGFRRRSNAAIEGRVFRVPAPIASDVEFPNRVFGTIVPNVPPRFRPSSSLLNYHLLWEPVWERKPPNDPALLKRLSGSLYAVLATWDLTPIEQAVLGTTRA